MAIFNNMYITNAGQALFTKAQAGRPIVFTKMQVGSGQIGTQNPATLNALITPKFDVNIQSITSNTDLKTATISGSVNNNNITDAVYICELGLFANDPDNGEILYGYVSAGIYGDYYAPASAGPYTWNYEVNAAIGNAANVTAQLSGLTYDYGVINTNTTFNVISGGNQKEINKSIDSSLSDMMYQTAGGTATAITLTINKTLVTGYPITFIASANNGGAATTINTKKLYKPATTSSPTLIAGKAYTVWYNSTGDSGNGCFFIKASAEGDSDVIHVLAGKKFSNDNDTGLTGTMPNNGAVNQALAINGTYTIPAGYHNGSGIVTQSITTKTAATYNPSTTVQIISAGQYLSGIQTIAAIAGTATDADVVAGKTYNSAAGTGRTGTATVASLGGKLYQGGTVAYNGTITLPFAPSIIAVEFTSTSTSVVIWFKNVIEFAGNESSKSGAGQVPNTGIVVSGNSFTWKGGTATGTYYAYA